MPMLCKDGPRVLNASSLHGLNLPSLSNNNAARPHTAFNTVEHRYTHSLDAGAFLFTVRMSYLACRLCYFLKSRIIYYSTCHLCHSVGVAQTRGKYYKAVSNCVNCFTRLELCFVFFAEVCLFRDRRLVLMRSYFRVMGADIPTFLYSTTRKILTAPT